MSLDLSTLSPSARTSYLVLGRQYSSNDTLDQAIQTLQGLAAHGADLVPHGFSAADAAQLQEARDAISAATVGRITARGGKKVTNATYLAALQSGKATRDSARAVLLGARRTLHDLGDAASLEGVKIIDAALAQTRAAGGDGEKLASQLDTLRAAFGNAAVTSAAALRGGPAAVAELEGSATTLRSAAVGRTVSPGTPAETEHLDVLDGLIVTLARQARRAARAAAKRLGKPAIATAFELTHLYAVRPAAPAKATKSGNGASPPADNQTPPNT